MTRTIYFAENTLANLTLTGDPVTKRAEFLTNLINVGSEGFESGFTHNGFGPFNITFPGSTGDITAVLQGTSNGGAIRTKSQTQEQFDFGETFGRFNTTIGGDYFLLTQLDFDLTFSQPISAFGFYGTDLGDFAGRLEVVLVDTLANQTAMLIPTTLNAPNGSLVFWGFIDDAVQYDRIFFRMDQTTPDPQWVGFDVFGFDDFIIGDIGQVVMPPAPLPPRQTVSRGWGENHHVLTVRTPPGATS